MKKIVLLLLGLFSVSAQAQFMSSDYPHNEVKLNVFNTIAIASVEVGYERFIDYNQSIEAQMLINDRMNYHSQKGSRQFSTNSFLLGYNYYFGTENAGSGIYANPFIKYRVGDFSEDLVLSEGANPQKVVTDMNAFIIGFGGGYKWNTRDKFVMGPFASIARNFNKEATERFAAVEFNAGFSIGYRF